MTVLNPTNLVHRTTDWESDIVGLFQRSNSQQEIVTERDTPVGRSLSLARPLTVTNASCLACHSTPSVAPASMTKLYGEANGFGWHVGEVIGAQIISLPLAVPLEKAHQTLKTLLLSLLGVFLVMMLILNTVRHSGQRKMSCGRPLSVGMETGSGFPAGTLILSVSMSALIAKALPVCRWQSRQWQQWTNMGSAVRQYWTAPQAQ